MDQPVQGPGTNYRRLFRKKPTSAQIVKQAFDHPFMGDHENPFPSPFFTCIDNRLQAPVPHPASIFSARGTKIPSGFFLLEPEAGGASRLSWERVFPVHSPQSCSRSRGSLSMGRSSTSLILSAVSKARRASLTRIRCQGDALNRRPHRRAWRSPRGESDVSV